MNGDLFAPADSGQPWAEALGPGSTWLHAFASTDAATFLAAIEAVVAQAPFRHMRTPGGATMAVAMSNCGPLGWISDAAGYRYSPLDPCTGQPWPALPEALRCLAVRAATAAGFPGFAPDACLINRYLPGTRLSLHQDKDERDLRAPIVSLSLGIPAVFLFGGLRRSDKTLRMRLLHGDVLVWGGPDRLRFHGILPLAEAEHPLLGAQRINLTFRQAG